MSQQHHISNPSEMSAEDEDRLATEEILLNEGWQRGTPFNPYETGPAPLPPSTQHQEYLRAHNATTPPIYNADGRMAVSVFPILPALDHPPMPSRLLPPNNSSRRQSTVSSAAPFTAPAVSLRFQSHINQISPWQDNFFGFPSLNNNGHAPIIEPSELFEYQSSTSQAAPVVVGTEMVPMTTMQGTDVAYTSRGTSSHWNLAPIHPPPPPPAAARPSGPYRSRKSKGKRMNPLAGTQGPSFPVAKRAAACWRCRKYRKPVSKHASETVITAADGTSAMMSSCATHVRLAASVFGLRP